MIFKHLGKMVSGSIAKGAHTYLTTISHQDFSHIYGMLRRHSGVAI